MVVFSIAEVFPFTGSVSLFAICFVVVDCFALDANCIAATGCASESLHIPFCVPICVRINRE